MKVYLSKGGNNQYHLTMEKPHISVSKNKEKHLWIPREKSDNMMVSREYVEKLGVSLGKNEFVELELTLVTKDK